MIEVKDLTVNYGMINAVKGVSFTVNEGEIVALIGAKLQYFKQSQGLFKQSQGAFHFVVKI